jgi:isopenicillin N synthase-like dioxygenase
MSDLLRIPTLDLDDVQSGDATRRARAAEAVREGLGVFGLVYVRSHGVDAKAVDALYERFQAFCARPDAEKQAYARKDLWYQRGWTPPNTEVAIASGGQPDFKECFFAAPLPLDEAAKLEYPALYPENVWPDGDAAFRELYMLVGRQLHEAGEALLVACARALGLEPDTFTSRIQKGAHVTRVLRYLPLSAEQVNTGLVWGEEHTDFNLLTLLPGGRFFDPAGRASARPDDLSGLYLRTRPTPEHPNGLKVRGTPPEGCIVAQVGQELEILTGGAFQATPHVITAPGVPGYSRLSSAHFIHVHSNEVLRPLPPFRTEKAIAAYAPPVLAGTYAMKTLVDIGLAPRETLDALGYRHYDRLATIHAGERR